MFDAKELRRVMGLFATGVTIITTRDRHGNCYGLTANAVTSLSLVPPLLIFRYEDRRVWKQGLRKCIYSL